MTNENNQKVRKQLLKIVELFKTENIPKAIKEVTFPRFDVPANKWSLSNRLLLFFNGSSDARGFQQWKQASRHVKKGSKAVYILAPNTRKYVRCKCGHKYFHKDIGRKKEQEKITCPKCTTPIFFSEIKNFVSGFRSVPVFRKEDTEGQKLNYEEIELPDLPLLDVAEKWGINVTAISFQGSVMGYYRPSSRDIALATPEEKTFFHELAHASQDRLGMLRQQKGNKFNEVTAELAALVLAEIMGRENPNTGATFQYIKKCIGTNDKEQIGRYLLRVLTSTEKIVNNIIEETGKYIRNPTEPTPMEA